MKKRCGFGSKIMKKRRGFRMKSAGGMFRKNNVKVA